MFKSVIQISTPGSIGTGFLIAAPFQGAPHGMASFVVTNKHMLGGWNPIEGHFDVYDSITLHLYRDIPNHDGPVEKIKVQLTTGGKLDDSRVAFHSERTVDVAVVRIDDTVLKHQNEIKTRMTMKVLTMDWLEPFANLPGTFGYIGARVFALGYPSGITSLLTNHPIAKVGHLAATPGEELALATKWKIRSGEISEIKVRGKLFLIDGLIVPGNSGGPVIFPGGGGVFGRDPRTGEIKMQTEGPSKVFGIVSAGWAPSGLSYAYATDYIKSLIDNLTLRMR